MPSCQYQLDEPDQLDWNKLFGIGFFPGHHVASYRFAWRWLEAMGKIELAAYWYQNGKRHWFPITTVKLMEPIELKIQYQAGNIEFKTSTGNSFVTSGKWPWIGYKLGLYFGGNKTAPHDIKIQIT